MTDVLRAEWIKLRTVRSHWVLAYIAVAFPFVVATLTAVFADLDGFDDESIASVVSGTTIVSALLFGVIGVLSVAQEAAHGTLRVTFAAVPQRRQVLLAKVIVVAVTAVVVIGVAVAASVLSATSIASARDADLEMAGTSNGRAALLGSVLLAVLLALLGLALGMLIRNVPTAVALLVLWPMVAENIVGGLLSLAFGESAFRWMPYAAGFQLAIVEEFEDGWGSRWLAGAYFAAWVAALLAIGFAVNERRDA